MNKKQVFQLISCYSVALIVLIVGINQLYLRSNGLSSWKGGGFGMYADMHPVYNKVFVKSKNNKAPTKRFVISERAIDLMAKIRMYPKDSYLKQLKAEYESLTGIDDLYVEVWSPKFDQDSVTFELFLNKRF